jgi:putative signal transducing protein
MRRIAAGRRVSVVRIRNAPAASDREPPIGRSTVSGTMPRMTGLVRVHAGSSIMEAEIVKARLESEGVPALLRGEGTGPYRMGPVEVWVPADMELHARIVLGDDAAVDADEER